MPLTRKLCSDATLHISARMKSGAWQADSQDAGITFSFKGVKSDGSEVYIHRHSSGQIRRSDYNNLTESTNDWFQIYFQFIIPSQEEEQYENYLLQVENNCSGTNGSDIYLDDICIYIDELNVTAKQKNATCGEKIDVILEMDLEKLKKDFR